MGSVHAALAGIPEPRYEYNRYTTMKNKILKDHFLHPRNMGTLDGATHRVTVKSDTCSDIIRMSASIDDDVIRDIRTEVYGCGYSIAGASLFTATARGKRLAEIPETYRGVIAPLTGDIPPHNESCLLLPLKAFLALRSDAEAAE